MYVAPAVGEGVDRRRALSEHRGSLIVGAGVVSHECFGGGRGVHCRGVEFTDCGCMEVV